MAIRAVLIDRINHKSSFVKPTAAVFFRAGAHGAHYRERTTGGCAFVDSRYPVLVVGSDHQRDERGLEIGDGHWFDSSETIGRNFYQILGGSGNRVPTNREAVTRRSVCCYIGGGGRSIVGGDITGSVDAHSTAIKGADTVEIPLPLIQSAKRGISLRDKLRNRSSESYIYINIYLIPRSAGNRLPLQGKFVTRSISNYSGRGIGRRDGAKFSIISNGTTGKLSGHRKVIRRSAA